MADNLYRLHAINDHLRVPVVYERDTWSVFDPWTAVPYLFAVSATETLGTSINQARLVYDYGDMQFEDGQTFSYQGPLNLLGKFIKIEWTPHLGTSNFDFVFNDLADMAFTTNAATGQKCYVIETATVYEWDGLAWNATVESPTAGLKNWIGIVTDEHRDDHNASQKAGRQTFTCHGLDWVLTRRQILRSVFEDAFVGDKEIPVGVPFNAPNSPGRHDAGGGPPVGYTHVFLRKETAQSSNNSWNALQIVTYLLESQIVYGMQDSGDLSWVVSPALATQLSWYVPLSLETHGRTVYDVINQLISGRRGLAWWVDVDDATGTVTIRSDTLLASDLSLPVSGTSVQKNQEQVLVEYDTYDQGSGVRTPATNTSYQRRYNQVIAEGARRGAVCTLSITSGEIQKDWAAGDETTYATAASLEGDYKSDLIDQEIQNDGHRSRNEVCRRVYTHYRIDDAWDLKSVDGNRSSTVNGTFVLRKLEADGTESAGPVADKTWINGIQFEHVLPLVQGLDYTNPAAIVDNRPATSRGDEYRRIFSTFALEPPIASPNEHTTWREMGETLHALSLSETDTKGAGIKFDVTIRPMDSQPGFVVDMNAPPHAIALNHFNPVTAAPTANDPQLDYDDMAVTAYITFPNRVRVSHPATPTAVEHDMSETLVIRLGDIAHLDYVPVNTVIDVKGGRIVRTASGFYIRDDRQLLRDVARMAWEWYGSTRKSFSVETVFLTTQLKVGQLVKTVNGDTVEAIVSGITWDFLKGTTSIQTQFGELDFREFVA